MAVDEETAVKALVGAKDIEGLGEAIAAAGFLDAKPGESRQKLRGEGKTASLEDAIMR